jgi:hypothetical protein
MLDLTFITGEYKANKCIELTKAISGKIDSPPRWMKTFSKHSMEQLKLQQSMTDPCIFYKVKNSKVRLIFVMYEDDKLCLGHNRELEWMQREIQKKF